MSKSIIIYDGYCRFCQGWANWLMNHMDISKFTLQSSENIHKQSLPLEVKQSDLNKYIFLKDDKNKIRWGADALLEVWLKSNHWSSHVANILKLPGFIHLARIVYTSISIRRHKLMCKVCD